MDTKEITTRIESYVKSCGCTVHSTDGGLVQIIHKTGKVAVTIGPDGTVARTDPGKGGQALFGVAGVKKLRELLA